jgi:lambda repressor-like predicted transcriptional regulator
MNAVVSRRLAFVPVEADRAKLADRFAAGVSIAALSKETGISTTRLGYCLRQDLVNRGKVPAKVAELIENGKAGDAWQSCARGITPQSIAKVRKAQA